MTKREMPQTEEEWKQMLTPEQYTVLREKGTEPPFSGEYIHEQTDGTYACAACGNPLFSSATKFETYIQGLMGWPSFDQALPGAVKFEHDQGDALKRTEVLCANCGSHLGHVFDEETETTTGKHFCINSTCLDLKEK